MYMDAAQHVLLFRGADDEHNTKEEHASSMVTGSLLQFAAQKRKGKQTLLRLPAHQLDAFAPRAFCRLPKTLSTSLSLLLSSSESDSDETKEYCFCGCCSCCLAALRVSR